VILAVFERSEESREGEPNGESENCDGGVRGSVASAPWEENAHVRISRPQGNKRTRSSRCMIDPPKRSSGVVKRPVPQ